MKAYDLGNEAAQIGVSFDMNPYLWTSQHDDWVTWNVGWFAFHNK